MDTWIAEICTALGVPEETVDVPALLDLARDAAHHVERPAAPVTTFIVGYALAARARGGGPANGQATAALSAEVAAMAREWGTSTGR